MPRKSRLWQTCEYPRATRRTCPARSERHHGDPLADRPPFTPLPTAAIVPTSRGRAPPAADTGVHRPVQDVQIGAADPRVGHIDRHLADAGTARLGLDDAQRPLTDVTRRAHVARFARHDGFPKGPVPPAAGTGASARSRPCSLSSPHTAAGTPDRYRPILRSICPGERAPTHTLATAGCANANANAAAGSDVP